MESWAVRSVILETVGRLQMTESESVREHFLQSADVKRSVAEECVEPLIKVVDTLEKSLRSGGKVMLCGNGGSAADAQHLAAEFTNRLRPELDRRPLAALALTTDTSFLTACSNDYKFDEIFERQVRALGEKQDVLIGISTSGRSKNVIRAINRANMMDIRTVGLTGGDGGSLAEIPDISVVVPSEKTQYIQEAHISVGHIAVELLERRLFEA